MILCFGNVLFRNEFRNSIKKRIYTEPQIKILIFAVYTLKNYKFLVSQKL